VGEHVRDDEDLKEGEHVVTRFHWIDTHQQDFMGIPGDRHAGQRQRCRHRPPDRAAWVRLGTVAAQASP
jgi:hypothetical protein